MWRLCYDPGMMDGIALQTGVAGAGFSDWASLVITVFLLLAGAREIERTRHWPRGWKRVVLVYGSVFVGLTLLASGGVWLASCLQTGAEAEGRQQVVQLLTVGFSQAVTGAVLLAAALGLRSGEPERRVRLRRLLPVVDRWRAAGKLRIENDELRKETRNGSGRETGELRRDTQSGRRRGQIVFGTKRPWGAETLEWVLWLAGVLAFSASWMWIAVHVAGAGVGQEVLEALAPKEGTSQAAQVVATLALVFLAPLVEEVIFRGFTQGWVTVLWPKRWGGRHWARGMGILIPALLWALCHGGQIDPVWVKWVQIFGLGLALGVVRLRQGLEACVALHLVFNLIGGFYLPTEFSGG